MKLKDLLVPGKPILVTNKSNTASEMMVVESAIALGKEVRKLDLEFADTRTVESAFASYNPGDIVMVIESRRSSEEAQLALQRLMNHPELIVAVADSEVTQVLDPKVFAHWAKF